MALLAFLNHWLTHETYEYFLAAVKTLQVAVIHDIAALVACHTQILILKELSGTSEGAVLTIVNTKSTGNSQFKYQSFTSESFGRTVQTLDQCIDLAVEHSSESLEPLLIAKLNKFLAKESKLASHGG